MRFQIIQAVAGLVLVTHVGANIALSVTVDTDEDQKPGMSHMEAATELLAEWRDPSIMDCCRVGWGGYCADGTEGTPYCGYGKCNAFGCNCDGGCRKAKQVKGVVTTKASLEDPTIMECCAADSDGYCRDGTGGTPYCGYGECNILGCNCDGGCRKADSVMASVPTLEDPSIMDCCLADSKGLCDDGTEGTPYCGYGQCNVLGCNCDGGCRSSNFADAAPNHNKEATRQKLLEALESDALNGPALMECCYSDGGYCRDGTRGTPYCGYRECNWLGCDCGGGCRKPRSFSGLFTDNIVTVTASEAYQENMQQLMRAEL